MTMRILMTAATLLVVALAPVTLDGAESESTSYALEWVTTEGNGGGEASSTNYTVVLTIGQSVIGETEGTSYDAQLGFWYGFDAQTTIFSDGFESSDTSAWSSSIP